MNRNFQGEATESLNCKLKMKFYFVIFFFCIAMFMLSCVAKYHMFQAIWAIIIFFGGGQELLK